MDNQIDECDPQQYREEWFDVAINPIGREFELPNLSNTCSSHWLVDNSNPPANISSDPSLANQICVHSVSSMRNYSGTSALLVTRKQLQSHDQVPFSDAFHSTVVTAGQLRHQNPHFKGNIATNSLSNNENSTNQISRGTARAPILPNIGHCLSSKIINHFVANDDSIKPKQEAADESQAHIPHGKNNLSCSTLHHKTSIKSSEAQFDMEGEHRCFVCNVTFATGNALGGHMSSHAKKRKMEVMKNGGDLSIFKSQNGSNLPPNQTDPAITSCDCPTITVTTTEKKIMEGGNKASVVQHEGSSANTHDIDVDDHEHHGLSTQ